MWRDQPICSTLATDGEQNLGDAKLMAQNHIFPRTIHDLTAIKYVGHEIWDKNDVGLITRDHEFHTM